MSEKDQLRLAKLLTSFAAVGPFAERARQNALVEPRDARVYAVSEEEVRDVAEMCSGFWRDVLQQHKYALCHNLGHAMLVRAFGAVQHVCKAKFLNVTYTEFIDLADTLHAMKLFHFIETLLDEKKCLQLSATEEAGKALFQQTSALSTDKKYNAMDWMSQSFCVFCDASLRQTVFTVNQAAAFRALLELLRTTATNAACARDFYEAEPVAPLTRLLSGLKMRFQRLAPLSLVVDFNFSSTLATLTNASLQVDPFEFHATAISVSVAAVLASRQLHASGLVPYLHSMLFSHMSNWSSQAQSLLGEQALIVFTNMAWIVGAMRALFVGLPTAADRDELLQELTANKFLSLIGDAFHALGSFLTAADAPLLATLVADITTLCALSPGATHSLKAALLGSGAALPSVGGVSVTMGASSTSTPSDGPSPSGAHPHPSVAIPQAGAWDEIDTTPRVKLTAKDKVFNFLTAAIGAPEPAALVAIPAIAVMGSTPPSAPLHAAPSRASAAAAEFLQQAVALVASLLQLSIPSGGGTSHMPVVVKRAVVGLVSNTVFSSPDLYRVFNGAQMCSELLQMVLCGAAVAGSNPRAIDLCGSVDSGTSEPADLHTPHTIAADFATLEDAVFAAVENVFVALRLPPTLDMVAVLQKMANPLKRKEKMTAVSFARVWQLWQTALERVLHSTAQHPLHELGGGASTAEKLLDISSSAQKVLRHFILSLVQDGLRVFASPVEREHSMLEIMSDKDRQALLDAEDEKARLDEDTALQAFVDVFATLSAATKVMVAQTLVPDAVMMGLKQDHPRMRATFLACLTKMLADGNGTAVAVCAKAIHDAARDDTALVAMMAVAFTDRLGFLQSRASFASALPAVSASQVAGKSKREMMDAFRRQLVDTDLILTILDRICATIRAMTQDVPERLRSLFASELRLLFQLVSLYESRYDKLEENVVRLRQMGLIAKVSAALTDLPATDDVVRAVGQAVLDAASSNYDATATAAMAFYEPFAVRQMNCHADKTVFLDLVPPLLKYAAGNAALPAEERPSPIVPNLILAFVKVMETTGNIDSPALVEWAKETGRTELLSYLHLPVASLHKCLPTEGNPQQLKRFWTPLLKNAAKRSAMRYHSSGGVVLTVPSVPEKGLSVSFWMMVDSAMRCIPLFALRGVVAAGTGEAVSATLDHTLALTLEDMDTIFLQDGGKRVPVNEAPIQAFAEKKFLQYTLVLVNAHSLRVHIQGRPCGSVDAKYFLVGSQLVIHLGFVGAVADSQRVFSIAGIQVWRDELTDPQVLSDHCLTDSERHNYKILSHEVPRELSPETPKVPMPFECRMASFHAGLNTGNALVNTLSAGASSSGHVTAEIVGHFSPLSAGYLNYHAWFATHGGLKLLLQWLDIAASPKDMDVALQLFAETVRAVSVAEVIRGRLYALAAYHMRTNARCITEAGALSLVRLLSSVATVDRQAHGIIINKVACDHIVSEVGIIAGMRTGAAVTLLTELQKLFDCSSNKFARRNAAFVVGIRFVVKLIHGVVDYGVMCQLLQREILQLVSKVMQATDFNPEIVQALTSLAAMLVPQPVLYVGKATSPKIIIPLVKGFTALTSASHVAPNATDSHSCSPKQEASPADPGADHADFALPKAVAETGAEDAHPSGSQAQLNIPIPIPQEQDKREAKSRDAATAAAPVNSCPEFSQLNIPITFAQCLSKNILRSFMEFKHNKDFLRSFALVVSVPWFIASVDRFAHPLGVVYAARLFFEAVAVSSSLQEAVSASVAPIVEALRQHARNSEMLFVLLASAFGISSHIRLSSTKSYGQQLDDVIGSVKLAPNPVLMPILAGVLQHHVSGAADRLRAGVACRASPQTFLLRSARETPLRLKRLLYALQVVFWLKRKAEAKRAAVVSNVTSCTVSRLGSVEPAPADPDTTYISVGPPNADDTAAFGDLMASPQSDGDLAGAGEVSMGNASEKSDAWQAFTQEELAVTAADEAPLPVAVLPTSPTMHGRTPAMAKRPDLLVDNDPLSASTERRAESPQTPSHARLVVDSAFFKDTQLLLRLMQRVVADSHFFPQLSGHAYQTAMLVAFLSFKPKEAELPPAVEEVDLLAGSILRSSGSESVVVLAPEPPSSGPEEPPAAGGDSAPASAADDVIQDALDDDDEDDGDTNDSLLGIGIDAACDEDDASKLSLSATVGSLAADPSAAPLSLAAQAAVEDVHLQALPIATILLRASLSAAPRASVPLEVKYGTTGHLLFEVLALARDPDQCLRVAVLVIIQAITGRLRAARKQPEHEDPKEASAPADATPAAEKTPTGAAAAAATARAEPQAGCRSWDTRTLPSVVALQQQQGLHLPNLIRLVGFLADRALVVRNREHFLGIVLPLLSTLHRGWPKHATAAADADALAAMHLELRDETVRLCLVCLCDGHGSPDTDVAPSMVLSVLAALQLVLSRDFTANYRVEQLLRVLYCIYRHPENLDGGSSAEFRQRLQLITACLRFTVRVYKVPAGAPSRGVNVLRHALSGGFINRLDSIYQEFTEALLVTAPAAADGGPLSDATPSAAVASDTPFHDYMNGAARVAVDLIMSKRPKSKFERNRKLEKTRLAEYRKRYDNLRQTWAVITQSFGNQQRRAELDEFYGGHSSGVVELCAVSSRSLHWLTFHDVSRLYARSSGGGLAKADAMAHYMDPKRNVVPFQRAHADNHMAAIDSATSEHLTGHLSTYVPQMVCRCPPFVGDETFLSKLNPSIALTRSAMRALKYLVYANETVRFVCNAFRSSGLTITPCLLILTENTLKLLAYACLTPKGDILLNAFETYRSGAAAESIGIGAPMAAATSTRRSFSHRDATPEHHKLSIRSKSKSLIATAASMVRNRARALFTTSKDDHASAGVFYSQSILALHGGHDRGSEGLCWFFNVSTMTRVQSVAFLQQDAGVSISMLFEDGPMLAVMDANHSMNATVRNTLVKELSQLLKQHPCEFVDDASCDTSLAVVTSMWASGNLSSYDYLLYANRMAGRLRKDLNQYPVFPWVVADYVSPQLDLSNPLVYRDLSLPIGAQTAAKREELAERFESLADDETSTPFHFGTHYSSAGGVLYFLLRSEPYRTLAVELQGGDYDHAARLFHSIADTYQSVTSSSTDCKELIPEFYSLPHFLQNVDRLALGTRGESDTAVDHVVLPPWANGAVDVFISAMRQALESPLVRAALPQWLDLVFGVKQTGEPARLALNVFQRMTYRAEVAKAMSDAADPSEREAIVAHADNFGQTPRQIFAEPHPPCRGAASFSRIGAILHYAATDKSRFVCVAAARVLHVPAALQHAFATDAAIVSLVPNTRTGKIVACPSRVIAVPESPHALCWHREESMILRHSLESSGFLSAVKFETPFQGMELVECLYASRSENVIIVGMSTGVLYGVYPDTVLQWNVVGATLQHHTRPVAGLAVSEYLSRMITFTRPAVGSRMVSACDGVAVHDPPMVWRLTKLFVSAMHVLDTAAAFEDTAADVVAAVIDDRDSSSIVASQREVAVFDACGTLRGTGLLPRGKAAYITVLAIDRSKEWASGRTVLYSGHQDGTIGLWVCSVLLPSESAHRKTLSVQFVTTLCSTSHQGSAVTALAQEPILNAAPLSGQPVVLLELIAGHQDGSVTVLQCVESRAEE